MDLLLAAAVIYAIVVYPTIKILAAVRRGEPIGLDGITLVGD